MKNNKIIRWFLRHSLTIASCALITGLGVAFLIWASPQPTTIGEDISTRNITASGNVTVSGDLRAKTGRTATIVVAASNSATTSKAQADFVATGVNDQVTIQAAIGALPAGGGKVLLLEGTYNVGLNLTGPIARSAIAITRPNITLTGVGAATILRLVDNALPGVEGEHISIIIASGVTNVHVADLTIDLNRAGNPEPPRRMYHGVRFWGVSNSSIRGIWTLPGTYAEPINLHSSRNNVVANNIIVAGGGDGIDLANSSFNTIIGNIVRDTTTSAGIDINTNSHRNTIIGNIITNCVDGIELRAAGEGVSGNTIIGNVISDIVGGGINGVGIWLRDGGVGTIIKGNTIRNARVGIAGGIEAGMARSLHNTIEGNVAEVSREDGILLSSGDNHNSIIDNVISGSGRNGILLSASSNNSISGNRIRTSSQHGIVISWANNNLVSGNYVTESSQAAHNAHYNILLISANRNTVVNNVCRMGDLTNRPRAGIFEDSGSSENTIRGNDLRNAGATWNFFIHASVPITHAWEWHSDLFMDVLAASATHIHGAIRPDGLARTAVTSPDVPRNTMIRITNTAATAQTPSGGNIVIEGISARGTAISETLVVPATSIPAGGASDIFGSGAFATVSRVVYYTETNPNITVSVGISNRLGLSNVIHATGDVFKVKRGAADIAVGPVDTINGTVDQGPIVAGDDFTIWYRSNLNIIR